MHIFAFFFLSRSDLALLKTAVSNNECELPIYFSVLILYNAALFLQIFESLDQSKLRSIWFKKVIGLLDSNIGKNGYTVLYATRKILGGL